MSALLSSRSCLASCSALLLAGMLVVGLNLAMERRVLRHEASLHAEPRPVFLYRVCDESDWVCELDVRLLQNGKRFDRKGKLTTASRG